MTDTPRTDAEAEDVHNAALYYDVHKHPAEQYVVGADFARTLERELAQAVERANKAESQWPRLKKYQPCGCIVCTCIGEQCAGCGARSCGTHDPSDIPDAVYEDHHITRQLAQAVKERDEAREINFKLLGSFEELKSTVKAVTEKNCIDLMHAMRERAEARACLRKAIKYFAVSDERQSAGAMAYTSVSELSRWRKAAGLPDT